MEKLLTQIEKYILYALVFLLPFFIPSISTNAFVIPKLALLVSLISQVVLVKAVKIIITGRLDFFVSNYDLPVFLVGLSYALSTYLRTPNKMEALLLPGTATIIVAGALIFYLINQLTGEEKKNLGLVLFSS